MKRNKLFSLLVLILLASMVLAACQPAATPTEAPPPETEEAVEPTEAPPEPEPTEAPPEPEPTEEPEPEPTEPPADEKVTIIIGTTDAIASLDAADAYATTDWEMIKNTGEGLLKWVPGTTDLQPALAADFPEVSEDGLVYTFKLREGVKFADGLDLTAPMYAEQLTRLLTIGPDCPNNVAGALATPYVESIEAPDDETIVFTLSTPIGFFSQILAGAPYIPTHPDIYSLEECVLFPEAPVYGVGPWFISQINYDEQIVLEPNPFYNGDLPAQVDQIIYRFFADPQTLSLAVQNGEVDIAWRFLGPELISGRRSPRPLIAMRSPTWYTAVRLYLFTRWSHPVSWAPTKPLIACTPPQISIWRTNS
jgi:peptide/nickel transport system substrate-binding protein